jgi:hypothetical protein
VEGLGGADAATGIGGVLAEPVLEPVLDIAVAALAVPGPLRERGRQP